MRHSCLAGKAGLWRWLTEFGGCQHPFVEDDDTGAACDPDTAGVIISIDDGDLQSVCLSEVPISRG